MSTKNRVFNKLAQAEKVELSAQRVALGIIDDADSFFTKANSKSLEGASFVQKAARSFAEAAQLTAEAESILQQALPKAKDLGAKSLVKEIQSFIRGASSRLKRYNKSENTLKGIN